MMRLLRASISQLSSVCGRCPPYILAPVISVRNDLLDVPYRRRAYTSEEHDPDFSPDDFAGMSERDERVEVGLTLGVHVDGGEDAPCWVGSATYLCQSELKSTH